MLIGITILALCLVSLFIIIPIHEFGHYVAGIFIGIPVRSMRIRLFTIPPHVALRDNESWVSPWDYVRYVSLSRQYLKYRSQAIIYISAGLLMQTAVFAGAVIALAASGQSKLYLAPITGAMLGMLLSYLMIDLSLTRKHGRPSGDYSGLWVISPIWAVLVTTLVILAHIGLLLYLCEFA